MNGSFRWIALETAHLQRMSALRPLCRNVHGAASVTIGPNTPKVFSASLDCPPRRGQRHLRDFPLKLTRLQLLKRNLVLVTVQKQIGGARGMAKESTDKLCNAVTLCIIRPLQALAASIRARTVTALVKALEEVKVAGVNPAAAINLMD
jgi:hypothetical protein